MSVSYLKLREILRQNKIKHKTLNEMAGVTHDELAKINKDEYMTLVSLERIAHYLSSVLNRQIKLDDMLDLK